MKINRFLIACLFTIVMLISAGCGSPPPTPSAADVQTAIAATLTAAPTMTTTPIPEPEQTTEPTQTALPPTPTKDPGQPLNGSVNVEFLNMRSGPSTFFEVLGTFEKGTNLVANARVPNDSWVKVEIETDDQPVIGWMFAEYIELEGSVSQLGLADIPVEQTISGQVVDENQDPIELVSIAFVHSNDAGELLANTITDQTGRFILYLPEDMGGIMDVEIVSPTCDSPIVDENCQVSSHILLNNQEFISIPQGNQELVFVYETAGFTLTGTVVDSKKDPVEDIFVTAVRDDGAVSYGFSDNDGEFALPISEGIWEVYAVEFNPRNEGDHVTVTVANTIPDPIEVKAPD